MFRKLSEIPDNLDSLKDCFYLPINDELNNRWEVWLENWQSVLKKEGNIKAKSASMKSLIQSILGANGWSFPHMKKLKREITKR